VEHSFQEGIPSEYTLDFDSGIFHQPHHQLLQAPEGWHTYVLLNNRRKAVEGLVHFHTHEVDAKSPYQSPYGSFIFSERVSEEPLKDFVEFTEQKLRKIGVHRTVLKNPPEVYEPQRSALLNKVLLQSGYTIAAEETSAVIPIHHHSFDQILHRSKKSRLKKCHDQQLSMVFWPLSKLSEVYDFISRCRRAKDYTLSMSLDAMQRLSEAFPNVVLLHVVLDGHHLAAASISIRVTNKVLYTFYYDHAEKYDAVSPVVFLCEGLFNYCQQNKIECSLVKF
jgi:hypothetical protein